MQVPQDTLPLIWLRGNLLPELGGLAKPLLAPVVPVMLLLQPAALLSQLHLQSAARPLVAGQHAAFVVTCSRRERSHSQEACTVSRNSLAVSPPSLDSLQCFWANQASKMPYTLWPSSAASAWPLAVALLVQAGQLTTQLFQLMPLPLCRLTQLLPVLTAVPPNCNIPPHVSLCSSNTIVFHKGASICCF